MNEKPVYRTRGSHALTCRCKSCQQYTYFNGGVGDGCLIVIVGTLLLLTAMWPALVWKGWTGATWTGLGIWWGVLASPLFFALIRHRHHLIWFR